MARIDEVCEKGGSELSRTSKRSLSVEAMIAWLSNPSRMSFEDVQVIGKELVRLVDHDRGVARREQETLEWLGVTDASGVVPRGGLASRPC